MASSSLLHYATPALVHRLIRNPDAGKPLAFPHKLSETGLFTDVTQPSPLLLGCIPLQHPSSHCGQTVLRAAPHRPGCRRRKPTRPQISTHPKATGRPRQTHLAPRCRPGQDPLDGIHQGDPAPALEKSKPRSCTMMANLGMPTPTSWNDEGTDAELVDCGRVPSATWS
jgi:hypothetical protein